MDLTGLLTGGAQLAAAYAPYNLSVGESDKLRAMGQQARAGATQIGQTASEAAAFQPYSVRFGTSTTQVGPEGITSELDPALANIQGGLIGQTTQALGGLGAVPTGYGDLQLQALQQAQGLVGQPTPTAQSLFEQLQASTASEQERQRLELESRLAGQGRLGVQTSMYGGTPEQLAFEKAIQEQTARNFLSAQQMAPQLAQQQIANATGLFGLGSQAGMAPMQQQQAQLQNITAGLGAAFIPQQQSLAALQPSFDMARIQQAARQGQTEALYRSGIAGLEAEATAGTAAANIEAARTQALANALSGMFAGQASQKSIF